MFMLYFVYFLSISHRLWTIMVIFFVLFSLRVCQNLVFKVTLDSFTSPMSKVMDWVCWTLLPVWISLQVCIRQLNQACLTYSCSHWCSRLLCQQSMEQECSHAPPPRAVDRLSAPTILGESSANWCHSVALPFPLPLPPLRAGLFPPTVITHLSNFSCVCFVISNNPYSIHAPV